MTVELQPTHEDEAAPAQSEGDPLGLKGLFDRVVVVNLKRRPDRLASFQNMIREHGWPFAPPQAFEAIDGGSDKVPVPIGWNAGGGAWGCMQSHRQILERALMDDVRALLVLEDDACVRPTFLGDVASFFESVPSDWEGLMLGGQHINLRPDPVRPGVVRCRNTQRTHAYAVRGRFLRDLYQKWCSSSGHCDHVLGPFGARYKVYAPDPFIFGQSPGRSDISGSRNPRKFWVPPTGDPPVVLLRAPRTVAVALRRYGFHRGYTREAVTDIDKGLQAIFADKGRTTQERVAKLRDWIEMIQWEVASAEGLVCTVWHPEATLDLVRAACKGKVVEVAADDVESALRQYPAQASHGPSDSRQAVVVLLKAPQAVVRELRAHGFHTGHWRDRDSDIDNGLLSIFASPQDRVRRLSEWIELLQGEAEQIETGVVTVWHPEATRDLVEAATADRVVELAGDSVAAVLAAWKERR
jgi:hypothetical protein